MLFCLPEKTQIRVMPEPICWKRAPCQPCRSGVGCTCVLQHGSVFCKHHHPSTEEREERAREQKVITAPQWQTNLCVFYWNSYNCSSGKKTVNASSVLMCEGNDGRGGRIMIIYTFHHTRANEVIWDRECYIWELNTLHITNQTLYALESRLWASTSLPCPGVG